MTCRPGTARDAASGRSDARDEVDDLVLEPVSVARDLAHRGILLFDRGGDHAGKLIDLADALGDATDRRDGATRRFLNSGDLAGNLLGRSAGLRRQRLDLTGDDGEAAARLAGARRRGGPRLRRRRR